MNLKSLIEQNITSSIGMRFYRDSKSDLKLGSTKFGGIPDLPIGFEWYYFEGKSPFDNSINQRPLSFIAQLDCSELSQYDRNHKLPSDGILYFFYELESMTWGYDPENKGSAKVFYYSGEKEKLIKATCPKDMNADYILPELIIEFEEIKSVPSFEELFPDGKTDLWNEYDDLLESMNLKPDDNISKLLGFADVIQNEMTLECEMVTNGIYCGDAEHYTKENILKYQKGAKEWKLLFQLDTVAFEDYELMFGDCGRIYFYIKDTALESKNFEDTWLILQC